MKYCSNCGTANEDEMNFCEECGAKLYARGETVQRNHVHSASDEWEGVDVSDIDVRLRHMSYNTLLQRADADISRRDEYLFAAQRIAKGRFAAYYKMLETARPGTIDIWDEKTPELIRKFAEVQRTGFFFADEYNKTMVEFFYRLCVQLQTELPEDVKLIEESYVEVDGNAENYVIDKLRAFDSFIPLLEELLFEGFDKYIAPDYMYMMPKDIDLQVKTTLCMLYTIMLSSYKVTHYKKDGKTVVKGNTYYWGNGIATSSYSSEKTNDYYSALSLSGLEIIGKASYKMSYENDLAQLQQEIKAVAPGKMSQIGEIRSISPKSKIVTALWSVLFLFGAPSFYLGHVLHGFINLGIAFLLLAIAPVVVMLVFNISIFYAVAVGCGVFNLTDSQGRRVVKSGNNGKLRYMDRFANGGIAGLFVPIKK